MFFYRVAFGGYEQLFSLFTLTRLGMDARDTSGLFVLAGITIIIIQAGLIGTVLTPATPVPWYEKEKVLESMAGQGEFRVSTQSINIQLPEESAKGWDGILWLLAASIPAAVGGAVLHPAINSLISKSAKLNEVGGTLGVSAAAYSAANAIVPLFYGAFVPMVWRTRPIFCGRVDFGRFVVLRAKAFEAIIQ